MGLGICLIKQWEGQVGLCGPSMPVPLLGRKCMVAYIRAGVQKTSVNYSGQFISLAPGILTIVHLSDDRQEFDKYYKEN